MANLPSLGLRNWKFRLLANRLVGIPHQTDTAAITSPQGREPLPQRTVKTENSEKTEKTWENLRNMEKVVYLCSANPKIGYPGKFPARGKPSPTLPNV
jgi:hypothetical protein